MSSQAQKLLNEILKTPFTDKSEAQEIICHVCQCKKSDIVLDPNLKISDNQISEIKKIAALRKKGMPLAYCMGGAYFYDREFFVSENVLIPRFDTEILIEELLKNECASKKNVLELGTGSGIICETLQNQRQNWNIISVDVSESALSVAKKNCQNKILLVNSDKFSAISPKNQFDIIVSNPPYIESEIINTLDESVKDFEPRIALDGGADGLEFYEYLAKNASEFLKPDGRIYVEIGFNQGESVPKIFEKNGFNEIATIKDFGGNSRVIRAKIER